MATPQFALSMLVALVAHYVTLLRARHESATRFANHGDSFFWGDPLVVTTWVIAPVCMGLAVVFWYVSCVVLIAAWPTTTWLVGGAGIGSGNLFYFY